MMFGHRDNKARSTAASMAEGRMKDSLFSNKNKKKKKIVKGALKKAFKVNK